MACYAPNLPGRGVRPRSRHPTPGHEAVAEAVRRFEDAGGRVKQLEPAGTPIRRAVRVPYAADAYESPWTMDPLPESEV